MEVQVRGNTVDIKNTNQEDILMTTQDVADFLKVSLRTAHSFIHNKNFDGLLYIGRSVRISKNKLMEYINKNLEFRA